jgi:hypothetical protein
MARQKLIDRMPLRGRLSLAFHAIGTGAEINDQALDKRRVFRKSNVNLKR